MWGERGEDKTRGPYAPSTGKSSNSSSSSSAAAGFCGSLTVVAVALVVVVGPEPSGAADMVVVGCVGYRECT